MDIIVIKSFLPEIFFSFAIIAQILYNIKLINNVKYNYPIINKEILFQTFFILIGLIFFYKDLRIEGFLFTFTLINDEGAKLFKIFFIFVCILCLIPVYEAHKIQKLNFFEFYSIFLLSVFGLLFMINSYDLVLFYLVMETQALCFYILASINRNSIFSIEAGLKYFISGSFISGLYLLGCSFIYGSLGTLNLNHIDLLLSSGSQSFDEVFKNFLLIGIIIITSTFLFKISCAPFHFWSPDVYDGSPIGSTLIYTVVSKLPLFVFFMKWVNIVSNFSNISFMLLTIGIFSTFVGTFFALFQKRLKRLIIYSSIAQTGFLVAGLSVNNLESYSFIYFFLLIYLITSILIWGHFITFYKFNFISNHFYFKEVSPLFLSSLSNFFKTNRLWSLSITLIFFSIGGIPPLTGFLSKMLIIYSIVFENYMAAIVLIIISSISVYYYIRIIKILFFEPILNDTSENFKVIYSNDDLRKMYLLITLLLSLIFLLFYFPTFFIALFQYMTVSSFGL